MTHAMIRFGWRGKLFFTFILILFISARSFGQGGGKKPKELKISIEPKNAKLLVGEQVQFSAQVTTKDGTPVATEFEWRVGGQPYSCGTITQDGLFTAMVKGNGHVYVRGEAMEAKAHVTVQDTSKINGGQHLIIMPQDTTLLIGEQIQYSAYVVDSLGEIVSEVTAGWRTVGRIVGEMSDSGLFTATDRGVGLVKARYANKVAITKIFVETEQDTSENDSVAMNFQNLSGESIGNVHQLGERDVLKISGLPFPLNVLNGGELVFPAGCLSEDIKISVRLSDFAELLNDSTVTFTQGVLAGVYFEVMVGDSVISPYYFKNPVLLSLPYKQELLDSSGLTPEDLWLFFYSDSAGFEDGGITNVVVDSAAGRIFADIFHFSEIVISSKGRSVAAVVRGGHQPAPREFYLIGNFPNPFNPETRIRFMYNGSKSEQIQLSVYNLIGQKVRSLYNGFIEKGIFTLEWDSRDDHGRAVSSGVYIVRLEGQHSVQVHKMLLLR
ncbi:T9SS type A sorting domain-containing protein [candidate division KSB1 bacterium]|nr:T9SS type A sorting domain-containing protein [candidate division KSB1 bacterium]